jgi:hypothetical protein
MKVRVTKPFKTQYEFQYLEIEPGIELDSPFADHCVEAGFPVEIIEGEVAPAASDAAAPPVETPAPAQVESQPVSEPTPVVETPAEVPSPAAAEAPAAPAVPIEGDGVPQEAAPAAPAAVVEQPQAAVVDESAQSAEVAQY